MLSFRNNELDVPWGGWKLILPAVSITSSLTLGKWFNLLSLNFLISLEDGKIMSSFRGKINLLKELKVLLLSNSFHLYLLHSNYEETKEQTSVLKVDKCSFFWAKVLLLLVILSLGKSPTCRTGPWVSCVSCGMFFLLRLNIKVTDDNVTVPEVETLLLRIHIEKFRSLEKQRWSRKNFEICESFEIIFILYLFLSYRISKVFEIHFILKYCLFL